MGKTLICALAITGFATVAHAADLSVDSLKDPLPDKISYAGVTFYGTVDVGGAYQSKGAGLDGQYGGGLDFQVAKGLTNSLTTLQQSALETSKFGVKIEEGIGGGWVAIGKLESGFNPLSGQIIDGPGSLTHNNGLIQSQWDSNGNSSQAGQLFNRAAFGGISNATYGTLTFGRQNSLIYDAMGTYDPQGLSNAFSILGYSGFGGGAGDTGLNRWDNSVKYAYQYGPVHAAAMYSDGGQDTDLFGHAYGFDAGATYKGFSIDAIYQKETGAASLSALSQTKCGAALGTICPNQVSATISDDEAWSVQGKYTFDLGGGFKDEGNSKLTLFGGLEHVDMSNPTANVTAGETALGGYTLYSVTTNNYSTDRNEWIGWGGAKYENGPWALTGAYYHYDQAAFITGGTNGAGNTCASQTAANVTASQTVVKGAIAGSTTKQYYGNTAGSNCAGTEDEASFVVDYRFNKHFDVYAGVNYVQVGGGLSSGFYADSQTSVMSGLRLKF